jgi:hypothetical protein
MTPKEEADAYIGGLKAEEAEHRAHAGRYGCAEAVPDHQMEAG